MASEWREYKIGDLGRVVTGKTPSTKIPKYFGGHYPFITIPDMGTSVYISETARTLSQAGAEVMRSCQLPKGSIMMSCIATIGKCGITTKDSFTNQQINSVICDHNKVHPLYLYYVFTQLGFELDAAGGGGSVYTNVSKSRFSDISVIILPLPEQRAIAHILGSLDDKIELNRRMNKALEATARAIFKSWFVDFVPVRVKAEGGDPGLPDDIAGIFPDRFEDSEMGEIPRGWRVGVVSDLGNVICGKTPPTKDPENYGEDIPFITIPDMHGKVFVTQTGKYLSTKGANTQRNKYLPAKTICVSCIATPGLVVMTTERSQTNQQINSVIPKNKKSSYYCYQVLNRLGDQIRAGGSGGSVLLNLNKTLFSNTKVLIPDSETIESYQQIVEPFFEKLLQNQRESVFLSSLRDTLLPKLISGELRIPDAEKFVEEAGV
ncbi:MAG: restriction endonuclease subunit S [Deltaproteobacteria bacterium]|nr:restriction endonuclease subunit S [Deltaproteobacteria bacterium]